MQKTLTHTLKLTTILLTVLCINLSCKEQETPEILPVLEALPITQKMVGPPSGPRNSFTSNYRVLVKVKGNVKVIEYGVLFSTYYGEEIYNNAYYLAKEPTLQTHGGHIITEEFEIGERVISRDNNYPLRTHVYQRAYAKLEDGRVMYSDIVFTTHEKVATPF
jgi:hypothetical protein